MEIAEDILQLLKSDVFASCIWNPSKEIYEHIIYHNMSYENIERYKTYFQFGDQVTPLLQKRRRATLVCEVISQSELEKTELFNDFLTVDGAHHGINVYAYDGDLNIGDLRIWRAKHRPDFGKRDAAILDAILPHFRNALRNVRAINEASGMANLWREVLENTQIAMFLFDDEGDLVFRNNKALMIEEELSDIDFSSFYKHIRSLVRKDFSQTEWGPFFLSVLRLFAPHNSRSCTAVMVNRATPAKIDMELLRGRYPLSPREIEICLLVCKGLIDQEIASALGIAFSTVRTHLKHIFEKLDVTTRSELIYVLLEGIVDISF